VDIPVDLRFSVDHQWVRVDGHVARIGMTEHAQDALGEIVHVVLPEVGSTVQPGQNFGEVESSKSVSEIYAPIGGVVSTVNEALVSQPRLINDDPYGDGWICEVSGFDNSAIVKLLDAESYRDLVGD
jgi:glycine cleavage system H protein